MSKITVRITSPKFVNLHRFGLKIFFTVFLSNLFFILISNVGFASSEQKDNVAVFLETLMIREGGLYTLLGSKPMTLFNVTDVVDTSEEGIAKSYIELKNSSEKTEKKVLPDFETYKKKCLDNRDALPFVHKKKLWDAWLAINANWSNSIYKLFSRRLSKEKPLVKVGLFVNVPQALHILKKYQAEFRQNTGIEFDPRKILNSIEDENSIFWDKVLTDHFLLGLLLGYGEKNAYLFDWVRKDTVPLEAVSILRFSELSRLNQYAKQIRKKSVTAEDLPIPYFVAFEINDPEVERYAKERDKIIAFLQDKDFVPFVLHCLQIKEN